MTIIFLVAVIFDLLLTVSLLATIHDLANREDDQ